MRLNVTFIIQIMNFWVTYFFLKKILFKPFASMLKHRDKARLQILEILKQKESFLKLKTEEKNNMLLEFQHLLKKRYAPAPFEYPEIPLEIGYQKNQSDIENFILMSKDILIKKVPHAYR